VTISVVAPGWQNPANRWDVDHSGLPGEPFPADVLAIINFINAHGSHLLPTPPGSLGPTWYVDVDGDGWVTPSDVLAVINFINSRVGAEGEAASRSIAVSADNDAALCATDCSAYGHRSLATDRPLRREREEAVSQIMAKWHPTSEYLDFILAPDDAAKPSSWKSAVPTRDDGLVEFLAGDDDNWLLLELALEPCVQLHSSRCNQ
jgi:hypothetical protein